MNNEIQFILYHLPDEEGKVQVVIKDETIRATQRTSGTGTCFAKNSQTPELCKGNPKIH